MKTAKRNNKPISASFYQIREAYKAIIGAELPNDMPFQTAANILFTNHNEAFRAFIAKGGK